MKPARSTYCGECRNDFESGEVVYFAWIENRSFCVECHVALKSKIKDWEPRRVPKEGEEID
ncbi:hypothetical protein [Sporosarcina sp. ITBMC105]